MAYKRGQHPNSRRNLSKGGRTPQHGEKKQKRDVWATPTDWEFLESLAEQYGFEGCGDFLHLLSQKELVVSKEGSEWEEFCEIAKSLDLEPQLLLKLLKQGRIMIQLQPKRLDDV